MTTTNTTKTIQPHVFHVTWLPPFYSLSLNNCHDSPHVRLTIRDKRRAR
jgi:hypothetical protein